MRKTKIICTVGPSTDDEKVLKQMILAGMDAARFNFSHSDYKEHLQRFQKVAKVREECSKHIATILDTKGPEIRLGTFKNKKVYLEESSSFTLTTDDVEGDEKKVSITYKNLPNDIAPGNSILIDDGLIELKVDQVKDGKDIICTVLNGGYVSDRKGVNVPDTFLSMPYISEKDRNDIIFGIQTGFDFIAASFVRCADDIIQIRQILEEYNCDTINIIAKIENRQGVDNIDEILNVSDGVMVARGDMGVEIPMEDVPVIQKKIITKAYNAGKIVITATQMLDSMINNPRPTRAEVTDVANAIYECTSAIMLSGETAAGKYPLKAVQTMVKIAERAEADIDYLQRFHEIGANRRPDITAAISHAACTTAHDLKAAAIIAVSKSGRTARKISRYRPACTIIGCSMYSHVCRQLNLSWGVTPVLLKEERDTFTLFDNAVDEARRKGYAKPGDIVVITSGIPLGISGTTNMLKVQYVEE